MKLSTIIYKLKISWLDFKFRLGEYLYHNIFLWRDFSKSATKAYNTYISSWRSKRGDKL